MPGLSFRFNVPPDQSGDPKIFLHRILFFAGCPLLWLGIWAACHYFKIHAPSDSTLHEVPLRAVAGVREVFNVHDTNRIDEIYLRTTNRGLIRYGAFWPRFEDVRKRDADLTLLVDATNQAWVIKDAQGQFYGRDYFRSRNLEYKVVLAMNAILFIPLGACMFLVGLAGEYCLRRGDPLPANGSGVVSARKFTLYAGLIGYLALFGFKIGPWLNKSIPGELVALIWVFSAGALGCAILRFFKPRMHR